MAPSPDPKETNTSGSVNLPEHELEHAEGLPRFFAYAQRVGKLLSGVGRSHGSRQLQLGQHTRTSCQPSKGARSLKPLITDDLVTWARSRSVGLWLTLPAQPACIPRCPGTVLMLPTWARPSVPSCP